MKKVSVGTTVAVALLTALLTFQITYVSVSDSSRGKGAENSEFVSEASDRLAELDEAFRSLYLDADKLNNETLADYILKGYIAGTGDPYAEYFTADEFKSFMEELSGDSEGIGVNVVYDAEKQMIEIISVVPDSPAEEAGVLEGDLVAYIGEGDDAQSVASLGYTNAISKLRGKAGTEAVFTVLRGDDLESVEFKVTRKSIESISVYSHVYALDSAVGIIKITGFDQKTPEQFKKAIDDLLGAGCDKFIMDVRYNPGGELNSVVSVLDYLLPEGPIVRIFDKEDKEVESYSSDGDYLDYPIAVITNSSTASAAELFTSALRDYDRCVVVGTTTYGKGCMQTTVSLPDGSALKATYRMYKPPFSDGYHGVGIVPDETVELDDELLGKSIFKYTDEEDNQLRAASNALLKFAEKIK